MGSSARFGPCVSRSNEVARALAQWYVARHPNESILWDLFPENNVAQSLGFNFARRLTRMTRGRTIQGRFEKRCQSVDRRGIRPGHSLRRHGSGAQLANHFFPGLGSGRNVVQVGILQRKTACAKFRAMAGNTVLADQGLLRGRRVGLSDSDRHAPNDSHRQEPKIAKLFHGGTFTD